MAGYRSPRPGARRSPDQAHLRGAQLHRLLFPLRPIPLGWLPGNHRHGRCRCRRSRRSRGQKVRKGQSGRLCADAGRLCPETQYPGRQDCQGPRTGLRQRGGRGDVERDDYGVPHPPHIPRETGRYRSLPCCRGRGRSHRLPVVGAFGSDGDRHRGFGRQGAPRQASRLRPSDQLQQGRLQRGGDGHHQRGGRPRRLRFGR